MKPTVAIILNDFKRRLQSPVGIILLLLIPLLMTALIGLIFSPGKNIMPKVKIGVVDLDNGLAARFLLQSFSAEESRKMFEVKAVSAAEGQKLIRSGRVSALLVIPEAFSRRLLAGEKTELRLEKNPAEQFLPAVAEQFVQTLAVVLSALVQVFADEIRQVTGFLDTPLADVSAAMLAPFLAQAKTKVAAVRRVISPLLISLEKKVKKKPGQVDEQSIFAVILPGMAILFIFFIVQDIMEDIIAERERGTLVRLFFAPIHADQFIIGKMASGVLTGFFAYWIMMLVGALLFRLDLSAWPRLLTLSAAASLFTAAFFGLITALVRNRRQASIVTTPVILVFGMLGGSMVPIDMLGRGFRLVSKFTPNYWFISGSQEILRGRFPITAHLVLLLAAAGCFFLARQLLLKRIRAS